MSQIGMIETQFTKTGLCRYTLEVSHLELHKYQIVKGDNQPIVVQKARVLADKWDEQWEIKSNKEDEIRLKKQKQVEKKEYLEKQQQLAENKTDEAIKYHESLEKILDHTLHIDDTINWEELLDHSDFPVAKPDRPALPNEPQKPLINDRPEKRKFKYNLLELLLPFMKRRKTVFLEEVYLKKIKEWEKRSKTDIKVYNDSAEKFMKLVKEIKFAFKKDVANWEIKKKEFHDQQKLLNIAVAQEKEKYFAGDKGAIEEYCDLVLSRSKYPAEFPQSYDLEYLNESKIVVLDYQLPSKEAIRPLKEVNYIKTKDNFTEKYLTDIQIDKILNSIYYQIALRTIHEIFESDQIDAIESITFNGYVHSLDPATGNERNPCIMSVKADKDEFEQIKLASVDPKACFKKLKGVGSSKLASITPVAPIMKMSQDDERFVDSYDVADSIDEGQNIAAMDWEDFEHLIRELFEKEFSFDGSEVKVTRASKDGGVDAILMDPDPIRGGKIVIQAKRYTNTVGVSAVRDLYGTVQHEGAMKGILVTTADYGPDAYTFVSDKPLSLISGGELLHLLRKHGHKAKIDLIEAKAILKEMSDQ